jgi:hypothetical protein
MATPTVLAAMPDHASSGYKYTAAISYQDGSTYPLCGCITKEDALAVCKGWMKSAKKAISSDILLRA